MFVVGIVEMIADLVIWFYKDFRLRGFSLAVFDRGQFAADSGLLRWRARARPDASPRNIQFDGLYLNFVIFENEAQRAGTLYLFAATLKMLKNQIF
jgi:hypothetical protein